MIEVLANFSNDFAFDHGARMLPRSAAKSHWHTRPAKNRLT